MSYVHGYSTRESQRLREQSDILEHILHSGTAYSAGATVLEAGCGVGAQTRLLLKRNPGIQLTSIDISNESLAKAGQLIDEEGFDNVTFQSGNILDLNFDDHSFDHIFICFVLEYHLIRRKELTPLKDFITQNLDRHASKVHGL